MRRLGAVMAAEPTRTKVRVWINGITMDEHENGVLIDRPEGLPKWMAVAGATFDVTGVDSVETIPNGVFVKQPMDECGPWPPDHPGYPGSPDERWEGCPAPEAAEL